MLLVEANLLYNSELFGGWCVDWLRSRKAAYLGRSYQRKGATTRDVMSWQRVACTGTPRIPIEIVFFVSFVGRLKSSVSSLFLLQKRPRVQG